MEHKRSTARLCWKAGQPIDRNVVRSSTSLANNPDVAADTRKHTLLVVDDDRAVRKLLERIAIRAGFDVASARDGQEALDMMTERAFEIVVVDLMMPRISGYDLVQKISGLSPRPTVIVATAMANGDVAKLDDSMVRRVIRKPFDIDGVARTLIEVAAEVAAGHTVEPPPEVTIVPPVAPPKRLDDPC